MLYDIFMSLISVVSIWLLLSVIEYSVCDCIIFREACWKAFLLMVKILIFISVILVIEKFFGR